MSHEIIPSTVTPKNNGSVEHEPPQPLPQACFTDVRPITSPATAKEPMKNKRGRRIKIILRTKTEKDWFKKMRGWIMVVAILVASVTYTIGLSPPGGFWQDDLDGHEAGSSILHDKSNRRYTTFFYANSTAFMASLVIIILLMNEKFYSKKHKVIILDIIMVLGLVSMMLAYAAGCARRVSTSIFVIVLAVVVLLFVIFLSRFLRYIGSLIEKWFPSVEKFVGHDFMRMLIATKKENDKPRRLCV